MILDAIPYHKLSPCIAHCVIFLLNENAEDSANVCSFQVTQI